MLRVNIHAPPFFDIEVDLFSTLRVAPAGDPREILLPKQALGVA